MLASILTVYFMYVTASGRHFLVDTGAEVSIIPPSSSDRTAHHHSQFSFQAVNSTHIPTYGVRSLTLDLGLRRTFRWTFIVADVKKPILGADFLSKFSLLVDVRHCRLSDTTTHLKVQGPRPASQLSQGPRRPVPQSPRQVYRCDSSLFHRLPHELTTYAPLASPPPHEPAG